MTGKAQADDVQNRQARFVRCCLRACVHRWSMRIFEHNLYADKEKTRRNTVVLQVFLTKFNIQICRKYVC